MLHGNKMQLNAEINRFNQGVIMSKNDPSIVTEAPANEAEDLSQLATGRVTGLFKWVGAGLMSAMGALSEALRPLFSWNPGRE